MIETLHIFVGTIVGGKILLTFYFSHLLYLTAAFDKKNFAANRLELL